MVKASVLRAELDAFFQLPSARVRIRKARLDEFHATALPDTKRAAIAAEQAADTRVKAFCPWKMRPKCLDY